MRRKLCCTTKNEGKKTLRAGGKRITNSSQSAQEFAPAPQHTHRTTWTDQLVTGRTDGRNSRIRGKVV